MSFILVPKQNLGTGLSRYRPRDEASYAVRDTHPRTDHRTKPHPALVCSRHVARGLVLGAGADTLISPTEVEATARAYQTEAERFPGMGHAMMLDVGWQEVADRILAWLAERGL